MAEDVSRVNTQFYDEWRVSAALSWMCEHGDVEQRLVGAGHAVSRSHESRHRVFPPCHNSLATRRQGKVPIFTHFSGSLIQEFSYSLEFSYSRTLLMNLEWETLLLGQLGPGTAASAALLAPSHMLMQLKVYRQKLNLNPKLLTAVRTQGIFGINYLLWCFCNIHLCMCMFHLAPCAMEASLW